MPEDDVPYDAIAISPLFLDALASLNEIGAAINHLTSRTNVAETLQRIGESAVKVIPGSSAVIYAYDTIHRRFDPNSRVAVGSMVQAAFDDSPRPQGFGIRAIQQKRPIISYEEPDVEIHPRVAAQGIQVLACFPMMVAEQPVGGLYISLGQAREFSRFELLMLDNFVNQAAMTFYQTRQMANVQRDLYRTEDSLKRLLDAGWLISSRLGLQQTLETILQMALDVTGASNGIFRLTNAEGDALITRAFIGEQDIAQKEVLLIDGPSIMGWVAAHRQPLCIHDIYAAPWVQIYHPLYANFRMRSELAVPLLGASGRLEGVLNLESPDVGAFSDNDSVLLQSLAAHAVIAIQEARLLDALMSSARLLLDEPCDSVLQHLVDLTLNLLNADAGAVWSLEDEMLILRASSSGFMHGERLPLRSSLTGQSVLTAKAVRSANVRTDTRFFRADLAQSQNWTSSLIVPLLSDEDASPVGAFSVYSVGAGVGTFLDSEWDEKVLTCLAAYAALALRNAQRQQELFTAQERQAVAETFAAVGDIAANVLHHLNNKVGTIPVRVQGIQDKSAEAIQADPYLAHSLKEIENSARDAMDAVRDSLAQLHPIHPGPVDVSECVAAALNSTGIPDSVQFTTSGLQHLPAVVASRQSLVFVFTNLFENAVTAMQDQGEIDISGCANRDTVEITVRDNGPGIAPELHERVFEFNYTGGKSRLGFGLWWVRTLVMRLGGMIIIDSDGEHGTSFVMRIPRADIETT
ncbi:MAG: GAF domain-containing protein [Anaerolineae bacterium]|nr:GAF domain-containing protein [Anaerolineae bacterium]